VGDSPLAARMPMPLTPTHRDSLEANQEGEERNVPLKSLPNPISPARNYRLLPELRILIL
jgi:hypothetical protein